MTLAFVEQYEANAADPSDVATNEEFALDQVRTFGLVGRVGKRGFDLLVAIPALMIALPFGLVIGLMVALTSRGPVLFTQQRVGRAGESFSVIKFRTMRNGTDREVLACDVQRHHYAQNDFKLPADDPRITRVGRVLRATSLDELPQLFNVIAGDMSIVGIRPLLAPELDLRSSYEQATYRALKPGMTGLWQVTGRSTVRDRTRRELDVRYVEHWSLWADLKIVLRTPIAVLRIGHAA